MFQEHGNHKDKQFCLSLFKKGDKMGQFLKKKSFYLLIIFMCFFIMLYSILSDYNFFRSVWRCLSEADYFTAYNEAGLLPNEPPIHSVFDYITNFFKYHYFHFDYNIIFGTRLFQIIMPLICVVQGVFFYNRFNTIDKSKIYRYKKINLYISSSILKEAFFMAFSIFVSYICFYLVCLLLANKPPMDEVSRELFADILGKSFYKNHLYLYYFLEGMVRFFVIPFILSLFSLASVLCFKNRKHVLIAMPSCYFLLCIISFIFSAINSDTLSMYISPISLMANGSFRNFSTFLLFTPYIIIIVITLIIIRNYVNIKEI